LGALDPISPEASTGIQLMGFGLCSAYTVRRLSKHNIQI
jgi:hypothetical protein